jgi:hypothetical protein
MEGIFPETVIECDMDKLENQIQYVLGKKDEIKEKSKAYAELIQNASPKIARIIKEKIKEK